MTGNLSRFFALKNGWKSILLMAVFAGLIIVLAQGGISAVIQNSENAKLWSELVDKSEAHNTLGAAYRECRGHGSIGGDSVPQCTVLLSDLAELHGLEAELPNVIADIQLLSKKIEFVDK